MGRQKYLVGQERSSIDNYVKVADSNPTASSILFSYPLRILWSHKFLQFEFINPVVPFLIWVFCPWNIIFHQGTFDIGFASLNQTCAKISCHLALIGLRVQQCILSTGSPCNSRISGEMKIRELQNREFQGTLHLGLYVF